MFQLKDIDEFLTIDNLNTKWGRNYSNILMNQLYNHSKILFNFYSLYFFSINNRLIDFNRWQRSFDMIYCIL